MNYREASPADAEAIAALHADSWQRHYRGSLRDDYLDGPVFEERLAAWHKRFSDAKPNMHVILAEENGELCGFACAYGEADRQWGTLLDNLHVRHDLQSRGVGAELVRRIAAWVRDTYPGRPLHLWALEKNVRAHRFYERLGGQKGELKSHDEPDGGNANGYRFSWADVTTLTG